MLTEAIAEEGVLTLFMKDIIAAAGLSIAFGICHSGLCTQAPISNDIRPQPALRQTHDASSLPAEAQAALNQGQAALANGEPRRALEKADTALALFRELRDRKGQAIALCVAGQALTELAQAQKALEELRQSLVMGQQIGDLSVQAEALTALGDLENEDLGKPTQALLYLNRALPLRRKVHDRKGEAVTLTSIGEAYDGLKKVEIALRYYGWALPIAREVHDPLGEATTLSDMAAAYQEIPDLEKTQKTYADALLLERAIGNRILLSATLSNAAYVDDQLGRPHDAIDLYRQALDLEQATGSRDSEAKTIHSLGLVYQEIGESDKAMSLYMQALPIERDIGDTVAEAKTLGNIASVYVDTNKLPDAVSAYGELLAFERKIRYREGEAQTLINRGWAYAKLNDLDKARRHYDAAARILRTVHSRELKTDLLWAYGLLEGSDPGKVVVDDYLPALRLAQEAKSLDLEGRIESTLMDHFDQQKQPAAAIVFGKQAINNFQQIRGNLAGLEEDQIASFLRSKAETYRTLAKLLVDQGRIPEAEIVIGMLKDEEYSEYTRGAKASPEAKAKPIELTPSETKAVSVTADEITLHALEQVSKRTEAQERQYKALDEKLTHANQSYADALNRLLSDPSQRGYFQNVTSSMQNILSEVKDRSPNTVGVYTIVLEKEVEIVVVTETLTVPHSVAIAIADLNNLVEKFRQRLQDPCSDPKPVAQELYKLLILPILKDLDGAAARTIVWELDGALRYIPMSALYDGHEYIAEKYNTVLFAASHESGLTAEVHVGEWRALGMGSSQAHPGLDPLAAVPAELEGIIHDTEDPGSKGPVPGKILLDKGFTPQAMKDQLRAGFPIVHIASHFVLKPGSDQSFLVLGAPDPGEPGSDRITFAQLRDTPSYRFNHIQLLTLSACETGAGGGTRDQGGKEIDSLGILSASRGANSALATLWSVSDASTGRLMVDFYRHWTSGNTLKVEALRQAQTDMLHGDAPVAANSSCKVTEAHPYFWAPFILIGNWQ